MFRMCSPIFVLVVLGLISSSVGQVIQIGQCIEDIQLMQNFELDRFLGVWYENGRTSNPTQNGDCSQIEFNQGDGVISAVNRIVENNFFAQTNATLVYENGTARFRATLPQREIDFWILSTDYQNFALTYFCENLSQFQRAVHIWQLGRNTTYATDLMLFAMNVTLTTQVGITIEQLQAIDHSERACYQLPVLGPNEPVILPGQCNPNIPVAQDFDAGRFIGEWHLISSYYSESIPGTCSRAEYSIGDGVVNVLNSNVINQTLFTISGTASVASDDGSARLNVTLQLPFGPAYQDLWVLGTDYTSYAVSYSCENLPNNQQRIYSWILSRTRDLPNSASAAVNQIIDSDVVLNDRYFQEEARTDDDCFFYPEPVLNQAVVFRGRCDQNIPAVPNFDAAAYTGLWHNIESYPSVFQNGDCNNALYTLVDGVVDVFNTQVVNETLDTMRGVAVLASNDSSARLLVTFPVAGTNLTVTTDYWVLDTDYENYALVYSCFDLPNDNRQVWSWKLSRTKQLSANSSSAITSVMNTVPVLRQQYYQVDDQSPEGCFYYPEPVPGEPVIFPGQCEDNIPVVANFNFSQFEGIWYEIETYPKDEQPGECINHNFQQLASGYNIESSSIVDQFLEVYNNSLRYSTNETNGRLEITINVNGTAMTIPYWILAVDYSDHALVYSCVNRNSDFRAVYSWKLSRSRQLSPAANNAMNNVIQNITVLGNSYYEPVDHSDEACFFLPELAPGEPIVLVGQCDPNITVVQNFNATRYTGLWRLIESYPTEFQTGTCNEATYTLVNGSVEVFNTQVVNQTFDTITGSAILATDDGSAKLLVTFPGVPGVSEYWVLDTDYESYSLVYSCVNLNNDTRRVFSWKLSRDRSLSSNAVSSMNSVINGINVLNNRYYEVMDHTPDGCFYYPEPDQVNSVRFRGRCDEDIPVVTGFDPTRYEGLWHDIESYPTGFQVGTCNNAFYTLVDGVVDVFNTEVVNQTLSTINGVAELIPSNDTSAKLLVRFPIAGTNATIETQYWVLATDYDSYSLVYSCSEIDDIYKLVYSWKLSRTKQLTNDSVAAINNVTSSIPVLDQRYYIERDQSPDGCFYFPEPVPGQQVVFPGQCDPNVPVVQNLNISRFEGIWHEIETYPKDFQPGQCINHDFTSGESNAFDLRSYNVVDQALGVSNSSVYFSGNDTSGRLTINIGQNITIPFWIIDTDYSDYALAYSCVNIDSDYRGVWSWKLSRSQQLSQSANNAINAAMSAVDVLENRYFEPVDQSDDACFYLPDLLPSEPVIFVGQCNDSIPAVPNFDAARYLGLWRLVETYQSEFQTGTCNEATYSLGANGTVVVYNTQVINETLDSMTGSAQVSATDGTGKLQVTFPNTDGVAEYWVLDTDYDSYSLIYSCANLPNNRRRVWSWKMSRSNTFSQYATESMDRTIETIDVLNDRYYNRVDRSDEGCFYYPVPGSGPVVFRGQCDPNITVVTNFDPTRYTGLWHDIESYQTAFQDGTCNNAYYTLVNGTVDVFNTQVINQTLDTINGIAVLASDDGSAMLEVTFPIVGTNATIQTPYWVLATDYDSYSLVYTCVNLDEYYRQVYSWKLSRTKQLSANAVAAINNVTSSIQVLDERYYIERDQSPDGCFYFPEPVPGQQVVFPGQCDPNVPVVQNLNISLFEGIWHEIETYPKDFQPGQCINHDFTSGESNAFDLRSYNVVDQALGVSNSSVYFSGNDTSGRLTINIGQNITIPFWIIDTDYSDYALAYSCVNIDSDYRGVWSWKLSRSRQLSQAANNAINAAMSAVDVLENRYFEPVDQSDDACFYLPDLLPGEPVVFVGQCDASIPAVPNFDVARYTGRWRLIETYHSEFQNGICNQATYTPSGSTVSVLNTQVLNQALDTMIGSAVLAPNAQGSGKLLVTFPSTNASLEYWILDTDYESYSLVYSCQNINDNQRRVWSWKLSRERELSSSAQAAINRTMETVNVLDQRYYERDDQSEEACFYFPEPDPSRPVVFRGQCDSSISVVQNFNATAYLGTWYDVQSYPAQFQDGTCPIAQYSPSPTGVDVYNTQVVNQRLDEIFATAVLANDDGSGILNVTFPIAGTNATITVPYWILATDYENYALVYACTNIDDDSYTVSSWKLSREPSLSASSNTAINSVMANITVLDQRYYVPRSFSEDDCFYYPENNGGPVILNGQCEDNNHISVPNFNANRFEGIWHEVSRFPSNEQIGECTANQYSISSTNNFQISQTFTFGERLRTLNGSGVVNSNGVIDISLSDASGVSYSLPLYILGTDYDEYALAFSCRNLHNNTKQIYSWKLSRSRAGLSSSANNAISEIVTNNRDLWEGYYETTDQTEVGCFYYPVFDVLPTSIELPGSCPTNIRAVDNFRTADYLGRWFNLARYPAPNQRGNCNQAIYSNSASADFDVDNNEVINRTLSRITGTGTVVGGSGVLDISLRGLTERQYVLATDYESYALIYACTNLDNGNRRVTSWKLSRDRTLSTQAEAVINNVIDNTQGLLQEYYINPDFTDDACFYVPEVDVNAAPIFRGQCEDITGVQNFNIQNYLGWWHEIETFPSDSNRGECISSQFQASGNQIQVVDTGVFDLSSEVSTNTVVAGSDGSLRLSSGRVLWVLATDYNTYSLVYSCENIGSERRRVWSAKYSKARSLTSAAQTAMSVEIERNEVLYPQFYQVVPQTDSACFHYPEVTGNQVILPGNCDENIPVVQNFQADEYTGTWYQIEKYPQIHESGSCIGARYSLDLETGVVTLLNWEVIDGELETIEGTAVISSTDGSARLRVTLPVVGTNNTVETPLYVLTTDYTSYSLAYSCVNVNEFQRSVGVWKLSRTRSMTAAGNTAINQYMATRQELHQPYFVQIHHDEDCQEPSSAFIAKSSIIVLLVCFVLQLVM